MSDSLASLVGQSLMFRFMGPAFTPADREAFNRIRPGGVLYFGDNLTSFEQIRALSAQLQDAAREEGLPPLFIAADQEGGIVTRLPVDMVTVPSAMSLGPLPVETIRASARITAAQLRAVGINTNYAPTIDINNNPLNPVIRTRSFGETPEIVARAGVATIAGYLDEGVIPTVKHFPGHGNTSVDSHLGLPEITSSVEALHAVELAPFKAAIAAGVPAIMTAHILFPALDALPATLSHRIITDLLRTELGFDGLIVTDSMSMDAIAAGWGIAEAAILAKAAGVDVLESSEPPAAMLERHAALIHAVERGRLPVEVFQRTAERLDALRTRFNIGEQIDSTIDLEGLRASAQEIARRGVRTASGNPVPTIADSHGTVVVAFARLRNLEVVDRFDLPVVMEQAIQQQLPAAQMITLGSDPDEHEIANVEAAVSTAMTLVICTRDAIQHRDQIEIGRRLITAAREARVIHVNLRGPYDTGLLGEVEETVYTYGDAVVSLRALASAITGA